MGFFSMIKETWQEVNDDELMAKTDSKVPIELRLGSVIRCKFRNKESGMVFHHYGIYSGNRNVIHLRGKTEKIEETTIAEFARDALDDGLIEVMLFNLAKIEELEAYIVTMDGWDKNYEIEVKDGVKINREGLSSSISPKKSLKRAKSKLGQTGYDLIKNNCEHFALWCRIGLAVSTQAFNSKTDRYDKKNLQSNFDDELEMIIYIIIAIQEETIPIVSKFAAEKFGMEVSRSFDLKHYYIVDKGK
jgi:hypothetical protein